MENKRTLKDEPPNQALPLTGAEPLLLRDIVPLWAAPAGEFGCQALLKVD